MKKASAIAAATIAGLVMFKALIGALEPRLVFFPSSGEDRNPGSLGIAYEAVRIETSDGESLAAWQLEPQTPIADVVYFHGNGGNLSRSEERRVGKECRFRGRSQHSTIKPSQ